MKAAVFHGPNQPLSIEDVEIDQPREREVLVRTVASGVCHSDLHFVDGFYPFPAPAVLGHEAAGIVRCGRQRSHLRQAGRPCNLLPLCLLRLLRGLHVGPSESLHQQGGRAASQR